MDFNFDIYLNAAVKVPKLKEARQSSIGMFKKVFKKTVRSAKIEFYSFFFYKLSPLKEKP